MEISLAENTIHVVAVAFQRHGELKVFVQSWINQTSSDWKLTVIHDGYDEDFINIMNNFVRICPEKINFKCTERRYNDWGHSLREIGLQGASGRYVLLTNADNYYIPRAVEFINLAISGAKQEYDVLMFDMVHSHDNPGDRALPSYSFFEVEYKTNSIDMGAAIVSTKLAKAAGFENKSYAADAHYFNQVSKVKTMTGEKLLVCKIPRVLLVHN
jgi:hypothetical protein